MKDLFCFLRSIFISSFFSSFFDLRKLPTHCPMSFGLDNGHWSRFFAGFYQIFRSLKVSSPFVISFSSLFFVSVSAGLPSLQHFFPSLLSYFARLLFNSCYLPSLVFVILRVIYPLSSTS